MEAAAKDAEAENGKRLQELEQERLALEEKESSIRAELAKTATKLSHLSNGIVNLLRDEGFEIEVTSSKDVEQNASEPMVSLGSRTVWSKRKQWNACDSLESVFISGNHTVGFDSNRKL